MATASGCSAAQRAHALRAARARRAAGARAAAAQLRDEDEGPLRAGAGAARAAAGATGMPAREVPRPPPRGAPAAPSATGGDRRRGGASERAQTRTPPEDV